MTEAQALAEAQAMYGADAIVWCITQNLKGQPYKTPRYRVGYRAETETGRFIENGRRMKGVGGTWAEAVYSAKTYATPRMVEAPKAEDVKLAGTPKQPSDCPLDPNFGNPICWDSITCHLQTKGNG
jgi:hypothetical protein